MRRLAPALALLAASCTLGGARDARPPASPAADAAGRIGRSVEGRPITVWRRGDPAARTRILVVGCVHGDECAGVSVARRLRRVRPPAGTALWLVPALSPDGAAAGLRTNARGVDLNRNFPSGWRPDGRPGDDTYSGPRPLSEPESRAARRLVLAVRPTATVWYHQALDFVWAWGPSLAAGRRYARASGMRLEPRRWIGGTATRWQNLRLGQVSFVVELPGGSLGPAAVGRHVRAVLALAR